tara:strand:- start:27 stop:212 length:186 start_codon:yes stop_codon:yes gene_type:complete
MHFLTPHHRMMSGIFDCFTQPIRKARSLLKSRRDLRLLMVGLDAAGKTTILYKLRCWSGFF